jgi:hypothetical protein
MVYERYDDPRTERGSGLNGGAIAGRGELQSHGIKRKNSKEKHGEGEEKLTNSPKRRKKAPNHP